MRIRPCSFVCLGLVLAACGSSTTTASVTTTAASATTATSSTVGSTVANTASTVAATAAAASTSAATSAASAGEGGSDSSSPLCVAAKKQTTDLPAKLQQLMGGTTEKQAWVAYADEAEANNAKIGALVPADVKDSYKMLSVVSSTVISAIRAAEGDLTKMTSGMSTLSSTVNTQEFKDASAKWGAYLKNTCGIDVTALSQ